MATPENVRCPLCDGPMVSRTNRNDGRRFWGCLAYSECKGTRDTAGRSAIERAKVRE